MGIFEKVLFVVVGIALGNVIGRLIGKNEDQKSKYGVIGGFIAAIVLIGLSFICYP